ncbi:MAG: signal peptidase I [Candidatus Omnitrophica bacterium]|nr:signal peptidase I [Candidatus Omnitrophota bacterium]MDE2221508.1 signal peptidase I [Candidatus Omnitrophota bacterium]
MPKNKKPKSAVREWVESILIAFVLAVFIRSYFLQPFKIPSGSMIPTLIVGDHLFVDKWTYGPQILPPMYWDIGGQNGQPPLLSIRWPQKLLSLTKQRLPGFRKPQTGDIIVFVYPLDPTKDFIKRLIAVGGETVEIRDGSVYINGKKVTDPRITKTHYLNRGDYGAEGEVVRVPPGYVFVMGDNTASSYDSRYWGFVPEANIIGKADVLFWPLNRIGILR